MHKVSIIQGTPEWHSWRDGKIGASEAPAIMGECPFKTPLALWNEKSGFVERSAPNSAMIHGSKTEKEAREAFCAEVGMTFKPACVERSPGDWMIASLDGLSECGKYLVEIKCPVKEERHLDVFLSGKVPKHYYAQLQHQLAVTGLDMAYFYSYYEKEGVLIEVKRDIPYITQLIVAEQDFYQSLLDGIPPPPTARDYRSNESEEWASLASELKELKTISAEIEEKAKAIKSRLITIASGVPTKGAGVSVFPVARKGSINIEKLQQEFLINPDHYRNPPTISWQVR